MGLVRPTDALGRRLHKNPSVHYNQRPEAGSQWNRNEHARKQRELGCGLPPPKKKYVALAAIFESFWSQEMKVNINSIIWPADNTSALRHHVDFLVKTLTVLDIKFTDWKNDPLELAKGYLEGRVTSKQCRAEAITWWDFIDSRGAIREFKNTKILMARLALCLLSIDEEKSSDLGEYLSWFIEVLGFMGANTRMAINIMAEHFEFRQE